MFSAFSHMTLTQAHKSEKTVKKRRYALWTKYVLCVSAMSHLAGVVLFKKGMREGVTHSPELPYN